MEILDIIDKCRLELVAQEASDVMHWLDTETWLNQNKFDELATKNMIPTTPFMVAKFKPHSLIPPINGYQNHLFALRELVYNGFVEARETEDGIEYRKNK